MARASGDPGQSGVVRASLWPGPGLSDPGHEWPGPEVGRGLGHSWPGPAPELVRASWVVRSTAGSTRTSGDPGQKSDVAQATRGPVQHPRWTGPDWAARAALGPRRDRPGLGLAWAGRGVARSAWWPGLVGGWPGPHVVVQPYVNRKASFYYVHTFQDLLKW